MQVQMDMNMIFFIRISVKLHPYAVMWQVMASLIAVQLMIG